MAKSRSFELDFGPHEKMVRILEECPEEDLPRELDRRLAKLRPEGADALLTAAALAATRSVRTEGSGRFPHGLLVLAPARSLLTEVAAEKRPAVLRVALLQVAREIRDPGFGPFRLLDSREVPAQGKEGTLFAFLEAVRAGETDWADHRFAWLVRNLEKEQVIDLLLSSGLEGVTWGAHKVIGVVEVVALLQALGWNWAPTWLRPIVRHQAGASGGRAEYDQCREWVAQYELLRRARRRPPGHPSWGERDAAGFLQQAVQWAESEPRERAALVAGHLAEGIGLEDAGDLIGLAAALLFLQETLRPAEQGRSEEETDRRIHLLTGALSMRQLVRLGTPGQRVLGLLLAGWIPPIRQVRLQSRVPDCAWWLPTAAHLLESGPAHPADGVAGAGGALHEVVLTGQANGLLPALTRHLERGGSAGEYLPLLAELAPGQPRMAALACKFERTVGEAHKTCRSPHRWLYVWAAALAFSTWPQEAPATEQTVPLQAGTGPARLPA
jgi:hypothetical protein